MKTFRVSLIRSYIVLIRAEDGKSACEFTEFYLGDFPDLSTSDDRQKQNFSIIKSEMTYNDAIEVQEVNHDE